MRIQTRRKAPTNLSRDDKLREGRASAQTLRAAAPQAAVVEVRLRFLPSAGPLAAPQSFFLYPAARAYFSYPCPHGDCDGIYDLGIEARRVLSGEKTSLTGVLECGGTRSCEGLQRQHCGLHVNYSISARLQGAAEENSNE